VQSVYRRLLSSNTVCQHGRMRYHTSLEMKSRDHKHTLSRPRSTVLCTAQKWW